MKLRDYESDWLARVRRASGRRVLIVGPTGCGKTVVASYLIRDRVRARESVLFVVHRRELVEQGVQRLIDVGIPAREIGVVMGNARASGLAENADALVQVATVQTLAMRTQWPSASMLIIDEAHHAAAKTYRALFEHYDVQTYGLTATPYRLDGAPLGDLFDEIVQSAPPSELIAGGWIVKPRVYTVPESARPQLAGIKLFARDYDQRELAKAVNKRHLVGSIIDHWRRHAENRTGVCFAVSLDHGAHITSEFRSHGVAAELVTGYADARLRSAILRRLASGETRVLVNCSVLAEGWDLASVKLAIIARPTMSRALWMQMAGRITRPHEHTPIVLDHAGNALMHGLPLEDERHSLNAIAVRRKRHGEWPEKACPSCDSSVALAARVCAFCDHEFWAPGLPEEDAGRLVLATRGALFCTYERCPKPHQPLKRSHHPGRTGRSHEMHAACIRMAVLDARRCQYDKCQKPHVLLSPKARTRGCTMHRHCASRHRAELQNAARVCACGAPLTKRPHTDQWFKLCDRCREEHRAQAKRELGRKMRAHWQRPEYREAMAKRPTKRRATPPVQQSIGGRVAGGHRVKTAGKETSR